MKYLFTLAILLLSQEILFAQTKATPAPVPCEGTADDLPGTYTDHTNPKYPSRLKGTAAEAGEITKILIGLEKLEEESRKNFELTGCVARVSFTRWDNYKYGTVTKASYEYALNVYANVCHVTEKVVKTVDEYRTVFRVDLNPSLIGGGLLKPGGTGEFYLTDRSVRYEIPIEAIAGPNYENDRVSKPSSISRYISEKMVLTGRSDNYKNNHGDFLKLINGEEYVENWLAGSRSETGPPKGWIDRHYMITKPGIPLLIPITRKQYLEDLLEYLELEKTNFNINLEKQLKDNAGNQADYAVKRMNILKADQEAYPKLYADKKAKIQELLSSQEPEWLQKPAVVKAANTTYDAYERFDELGKFYEKEDEYQEALYTYNPAYFGTNPPSLIKPELIEVQFRYEIYPEKAFSKRLFDNFLENYPLDTLRKMLE